MQSGLLILIVIHGLCTWRVARFLVLDDLINTPREYMHEWLLSGGPVRQKISVLLSCPWCITVWIAAVATFFWAFLLADRWPGWLFLPVWIATAAVAVLIWLHADADDDDE